MSYKLESVIWNDDGAMAFERIKKELARHYRNASDIYEWTAIEDDLDIIETELKALKFIKEIIPIEEKDFFYDKETDTYFFIGQKVSKEKYNFLKEVLLWD